VIADADVEMKGERAVGQPATWSDAIKIVVVKNSLNDCNSAEQGVLHL
jgi:hypothetical protein